jgi:hypothetical protein
MKKSFLPQGSIGTQGCSHRLCGEVLVKRITERTSE